MEVPHIYMTPYRYGGTAGGAMEVPPGGEVICRYPPQIFPGDPSNMPSLIAVEVNHAPQSVRLKAEAPLNMLVMSLTLDTSHFDRSTLKDIAFPNIEIILVTLDTSHFEMSALKNFAVSNMVPISVTPDTSHFERSALNDLAILNVDPMSVTLDTSHFEMSALNDFAN